MTHQDKLIRDIETLHESIRVNREDTRRGQIRPADLVSRIAWCLKELEIFHKQLEGLQNPRLVGRYRCEHNCHAHNRRVRIVADGERWRILFDPIRYWPDLDSGPVSVLWLDQTTYETLDAAKRTAEMLMQKKFHDELKVPWPLGKIDWQAGETPDKT